MTPEQRRHIDEVGAKVEAILHGERPLTKGYVLAEIAIFLAALLDEESRERLLRLHIQMVRDLIPDYEIRVAEGDTDAVALG